MKPPGRSLRAVIVDDERLARDRLRRFLAADPRVDIVGEADSGPSAVALITKATPDVVFLDIEMPGQNGFEVIDEIRHLQAHVLPMPRIIFVTAYDEHAVRAFEVRALDYIVKPFDAKRVRTALDRVYDAVGLDTAEYDRRIAELIVQLESSRGSREEAAGANSREQRLTIRSRDRIFFVKTSDVDWVETAGNYLRIHVGETTHKIRGSLASFSQRLDPSQFVRIHRRILVNVDKVHEMQPWFWGDWVVILKSGVKLRMSRNYRDLTETTGAERA